MQARAVALAPEAARARLGAQARERLAAQAREGVLVRTLAKGLGMREVGRVQRAKYRGAIVAKANQKIN